jgi:transposase
MASENQGNDGSDEGVKARRRRYSAVEKRRLLDEAEKPGESISTVARRYKIAPSLLFGWRKAMEAGAATGLRAEEPLVPASEVKQLKAQIRELERSLGRKTQRTKSSRTRWSSCSKKSVMAVRVAKEGRHPVDLQAFRGPKALKRLVVLD